MNEQLDYYCDVAREFLTQYMDDGINAMRMLGVEPVSIPDDVLQTTMGQQVMLIAQAADGTDVSDLSRTEVYDCIQGLLERLFSIPNEAEYDVPQRFWESQFGAMVMLAFVWASGEKLISIQEAVDMTGKPHYWFGRQIDNGKLTSYPDMSEPNPRRRNRLLLSEVRKIKKAKATR